MKPMKPHSKIPNLRELKYPVIASPKLDGIRCIMVDGKALSYNQKPIPNDYIRTTLEKLIGLTKYDGELMIDGDFNKVQSVVMSQYHHNQKDFYFNIFDSYMDPTKPFHKRAKYVADFCNANNHPHLRAVEQVLCVDSKELEEYWAECTALGYEGCIVRDPNGPYKFGRSTLREGYALKLKHFNDDEATIIGVEELMHNADTSTKRQENLIAGNTLGSLIVMWNMKEFKIGSGFDQIQRDELWRIRNQIIGQSVTFKYQEVSSYGIPRFPVFKGLRMEE